MILERIQCEASHLFVESMSSIRIKLTNRCPFNCFFCHSEGSIYANDLELDYSLRHALERLIKELGIVEAHLTGGEPTSYPRIIQVVNMLVDLGFKVKMTTNGQFRIDLLEKLKKSGIDGINFSIHTLNGADLAKLQDPPMEVEWGERAIERQISNMVESVKIGLRTKINTVIQDGATIEIIEPIIEFCRENNIDLRVLDDLSPRSMSVETIISMLSTLGAKIEDVRVSDGTSGYSYGIILSDGFSLRVKSIRRMLLKTMCSHCDVREHCKEWFYGIRIEQKEDRALVRLCVHRQNYPAVQSLVEFFNSIQFDELKSLINNTSDK